MNTKDALAFLEEHQPMPNSPDEALLNTYREVTVRLYEEPDETCIPLLLGSFADWDDWTIYDSVQSVLRRFPVTAVVPHLLTYLDHPDKTIRLWTADTVRHFPHELLVAPLLKEFESPIPEVRLVVAASLEVIANEAVVAAAKRLLPGEDDDEVQEILEAIIERGAKS